MRVRRKLFRMNLLATLTLCLCFLIVTSTAAQIDQTASKLQAANTAVGQAFTSVWDAESAGANVIGLLAQLNIAESTLAQAENSYRSGDSNTARVKADSVLPIAQEVTTAAQNAKQNALVSGQNDFLSLIALAVIGAFIFVLGLFLVWRWFRQRYINNLSEAKPEVNS